MTVAAPALAPSLDLAGVEATFLAATGDRPARLALWSTTSAVPAPRSIAVALAGVAPGGRAEDARDAGRGAHPAPPIGVEELELVVPAGRAVRRRTVDACTVPWSAALEVLVGLPVTDDLPVSLAAWVVLARFGTELVARGRIVPTLDDGDRPRWRIAELGPDDDRRRRALVDALPPAAHALLVRDREPGLGGRARDALQVRNPERAVSLALDACADALARSPAAQWAVGPESAAFAVPDPAPAPELQPWALALDHHLGRGSGAHPGIRIEAPDDVGADPVDPDDDPADEPLLRAVLQLRSKADPSLVIDAADLWDAPGPVLTVLGEDAEIDLLLALRRGAPIWGPLERALRDRRPDLLAVTDDEAAELLAETGTELTSAGFEVLWPTDLLAPPVELRAVVSTPAPASDGAPALDLAGIVTFDWRASLGGEPLTEEELAALADAKRPLVRLRGRWVVADPTVLEKLRRRGRMRAGDALAAALSGSLVVDGDAVPVDLDEGPLAELASRLRTLGDDHARELPEPVGLAATLRPYQRRGLAWMAAMTELGIGGCLADDMGLGKTIQLIALHLHLHRTDADAPVGQAPGPTLVVCPTTLLGNWAREIERFAPGVPVRRFHGGDRSLDDLAPDEVVLVTYGVIRRDHDALAEISWGLVVADEAQHAKNPLSHTARALRAVPAPARLALTGTPIENRLVELWSILDWTTPGLLGPLETFRRRVAVPIERHRDPDVTERLATTVRPFVLRRRKVDPGIAPELPPKTERDVIVPMTREQVTLYEATVRESLDQIRTSTGINRRGQVLRLLTGLKQITNHPAQFLHQDGPLAGRSGKLAGLDELLDVIVDEGESVLVFTQYVQMGRLLDTHLRDRGLAALFLNGRVRVAQRQAMVDRFQAGEVPILLLSLKAGGTGLNLTRATHVIHYDRWWNPAVEDQATDRAYRIGQDRPVEVHRLVAEGTVEDRIASLLDVKRGLAESIVGAGEAWISELSDSELADLVELRGGALTAAGR